MHTAVHVEAYRASFTLDSFIPDDTNRFAFCAAQAVASQPGGTCYNPLMIYGPSGVGKTHLLHAIANETRRQNPQARVRYLRADDFTRELVDSICSGTSASFREKFLQTDLLLLDDMQFLAGKEATQAEFYHLFNRLADGGCQIVLASDQSPKDIKYLANRLVSRFSCGLIADIALPGPELRAEFLRRGALERQLELTPDQIAYMAERLNVGTLQLTGALNILLARSHRPDMDMVCRAVAEILPTPTGGIDSAAVTRNVCDLFRIAPEALKNRSRSKGLGTARTAYAYLLAKLCNLRIPQISALMDRDPQTIIYLLRKADKFLEQDIGFQEVIRSLREAILADNQNEETAP